MPSSLRTLIIEPVLGTLENHSVTEDELDLAKTRSWIRAGRKIRIRYQNEIKQETERVVWPVLVGYAESVRMLAAWCELRNEFRLFRTDRIVHADFLDQAHGITLPVLKSRWEQYMETTREFRRSKVMRKAKPYEPVLM